MSEEKHHSVNLLPDAVAEYFLNSIDDREHPTARQYLHDIETAARGLLTHYINFEMDRMEIENNDKQEENRLAMIYGNCTSFGLLKKDYKTAEANLKMLNASTASQIMLHIEDNTAQIVEEMVYKKALKDSASHPFRSSQDAPKHIH